MHEVLVAERVREEPVYAVIQHVDIRVEVQRDDTAGAHQQILCLMHELIADFIVRAGLDGGNQHVIGLRPSAVLNLGVIAIGVRSML